MSTRADECWAHRRALARSALSVLSSTAFNSNSHFYDYTEEEKSAVYYLTALHLSKKSPLFGKIWDYYWYLVYSEDKDDIDTVLQATIRHVIVHSANRMSDFYVRGVLKQEDCPFPPPDDVQLVQALVMAADSACESCPSVETRAAQGLFLRRVREWLTDNVDAASEAEAKANLESTHISTALGVVFRGAFDGDTPVDW
jgi:hypothetical protein